ncbi:uncharacterized protein LOC123723550 [Papilio machaon]|uniref:uncharacterized protein LOC123723550 n=1 Tax=Papilio machaon TaxID=76193 RepID=UPI001E664BB5|nr:uncharacterized protein LOC123723550 [Papilio machaon]
MANHRFKYLKLGLLNVRSLNTGFDELLILMHEHKPDILALNETWIQDGEEKHIPVIPNYHLRHTPRRTGRRGGGVGFYVRSGLNVRTCSYPSSDLEQMWLEVSVLGGIKVAIGTVYRAETALTVDNSLDALSEAMNSFAHCEHIVILTDFNVDISQPSKANTIKFSTFLKQRNLHQLVQEPTRITETTSTLIDLVITDTPTLHDNTVVIHNPSLSDHAVIFSELKIKRNREITKCVIRRSLHTIDCDTLCSDVQREISSIGEVHTMEIDELLYRFNTIMINVFDKHAPLRKIRIKEKQRPWLTDTIKVMMSLRNTALRRAKKSNLECHRTYYKNLRNLVSSAIYREKKAFFTHYVNENIRDAKRMWCYLKRSSIVGNTVLPDIPHNLNDPNKINSFFLDLPGSADCDINTLTYFETNKFNPENNFTLKAPTDNQILKILSMIKTNAAGHDKLTMEMIRMTLPVTFKIIKIIINKSIESLTFPELWKLAKVKPLPKSPGVLEYKDLRPISILPTLSKVLERDTDMALAHINEDLQTIEEWAKKNNLTLNPTKCKYMIIGTRRQRERIESHKPQIKLRNKILEKVHAAKNLGLQMDSELRFVDHVNTAIRNAFYRLKVLYRVRCFLTESVRLRLVDSLILSRFNYCDAVYGPRLLIKTQRAIQRVQNACMRFCFNIPRREHITPYYNKYKILKMTGRRLLHLANITHKVVICNRPKYLYEKLEWRKDTSVHLTRCTIQKKMIVPKHSTTGFRGGFKFSASKVWNDLPPPLNKIISHSGFAKKYKKILLESQTNQ